MVEPITSSAPQDELSAFMAAQQGPLMAGQEWSALQALDAIREELGEFFGALDEAEKLEYVRLQRACIDTQKASELCIRELTQAFEQEAKAQLRAELKALTGQDIDPAVTSIHTRYVQTTERFRRAAQGADGVEKIASLKLWDAACINYDGLTGWSFPGRTGLADASYLDEGVKTTAGDFITLIRRLDIGRRLKRHLEQALQANNPLGQHLLETATAEFEFALIEALKNTTASRVDRDKYQHVKRALAGEASWGRVEEMLLYVPHGVDNTSWLPQTIGLTGLYIGPPPGDSLKVPHIVFAVEGCKGAFSFFPNRPGGSLRHHDSHREACEEFHVAFHGFYRQGKVEWLYQIMSLRDCARLKQIAAITPPPPDLEWHARLLYRLAKSIPTLSNVEKIGYVRNVVQKVPVVSLKDVYIRRSRDSLQELANETAGFMSTLIELAQTVINEVISLLLIPVPGALKGLGRIRNFAMFVALEKALVEGGSQALRGDPGALLQGFVDLADLLISGRLHTRLAKSVRRRHQRIYQHLSQPRGAAPDHQSLTSPQLLERMLGSRDMTTRELQSVLDSSATSRHTLNEVWDGAPAPASLVDAVQRLRADRLIKWVAQEADPGRPAPVEAIEVMAPLLTQLGDWPVDTALSIRNHQGQETHRYSKDPAQPTTAVVAVTVLENVQFAYATPRRLTAHLPQAIAGLLPTIFAGGELLLRQQLSALAKRLTFDLFDALTQFPQFSRAMASGARAPVRKLLPDIIGDQGPIPAVITQLQTLHPKLSRERLVAALREHPLSPHQHTQLLRSQRQPEALHSALRDARNTARREAIIDGLFHPRRFNRQTQNWAAEYAGDVLHSVSGQRVVTSPAQQAVPYVSRGAKDRTLVVIDYGQGRFAPYNHHQARLGETLTGADSFYAAVVSQIADLDLSALGANAQQAINEFRYRLAQAMLRNRAPDGSFYPSRRDFSQYVHTVDTSRIAIAPDALGLYHKGKDRYLFLEGEYFKLAQAAPALSWRAEHPSLNDAYTPVLAHNGAGAWRHEWETPLSWEGLKPFYRLGPLARALSPDAIGQIQQISGVTPQVLRRVHLRNERAPVLLLETVERFNVQQRVKAGVELGRDFYHQVLAEVGTEAADALVGRAGASRADQITVLESKVEIDKPQMERLFFKALCQKRAPSSDPLAQVLQRDFPGLTAAVAESLVHQASPDEVKRLTSGRVPLSLSPCIRWWLKQLRRARALEGLYLPAAMNEDSAKLILHALPAIAGWPQHVRVEVWERGQRIDSIGPIDGVLKRLLEPTAGHYQAYLPLPNGDRRTLGAPGAFLTVLLGALPPLERQAFGYTHAGGLEELMQEIGHLQGAEGELADTPLGIGSPLWFNPPRRLADGRIGYPLSGGEHLGPTDREQVARMRQLFPVKTDQEVFDLLADLSDSVREREEAINTLFRERDALNGVLERWSAQEGEAAQHAARSEAAERIRRCWRKEDSTQGVMFELYLDDLALDSLPLMSAHFGHVKQLSLRKNRLQTLPSDFFRQFPALHTLLLDGNRLVHVPEKLSELQHLQRLSVSNNLIRPDLGDVQQLQALTRLTGLDLSRNPLGRGKRLSLYGLEALTVLLLRNTQIDLLPKGAVTLRSLRIFDLRDNLIKVLTASDLYLHESVHRAMNLHGNALSQATLQLLGGYRAQQRYQNIDFGLWRDGALPRPSVERWLVPVPLSEVSRWRAEWALLAGEQMADRFFGLLWNLSSYAPLIAPEHQALRQAVTQRVWQVIEGANHNGRLKQILFEEPLRFMYGGIDGWLLCLNDIELAMLPVQMLAANVDAAGADFVNYFRAKRRLDSIGHHLMAVAQPSGPETCARILAYRIALASGLDLPIALPGRFDTKASVPDADSVNALRERIVREEVDFNWPQRLVVEEYWEEFLERKYPQRFEAALRQYRRALELATDKVGSEDMSEGEYKNYLETLAVLMRKARTNLIGELTATEWTSLEIA